MALKLDGPIAAPPRSAKAGRQVQRQVTGKMAARQEAAEGIFQLAGFGCIIMRQYADAGAIGIHSGPIVTEVVALSEKNEGVAKVLDYLTEAGPYAGLIVAVMPLALQIAANHGIVKAELVAGGGVVPPQALESQVRADMARQAAAALRAQQEAESELAAMADAMRHQQQAEAPDGPSNGKSQARKPAGSQAG